MKTLLRTLLYLALIVWLGAEVFFPVVAAITFMTLPGQTQASQVGTIQLAMFPNPGGLISNGQNVFTPTEGSGTAVVGTPGGADGIGSIQQGFIEQSNVDVVEEFVQMIMTQRAYESNSKVVQAANQMYQQMNQVAQ